MIRTECDPLALFNTPLWIPLSVSMAPFIVFARFRPPSPLPKFIVAELDLLHISGFRVLWVTDSLDRIGISAVFCLWWLSLDSPWLGSWLPPCMNFKHRVIAPFRGLPSLENCQRIGFSFPETSTKPVIGVTDQQASRNTEEWEPVQLDSSGRTLGGWPG